MSDSSMEAFEEAVMAEFSDADLVRLESGAYRDLRVRCLWTGWQMQHKVRNRELYSGRIRKFFEENPDEELTYDQFKTKFELTDGGARMVVHRLVYQEGFLERVDVVRRRDKGLSQ